MSNLPTGTVTFLFTDIEGSTALWERQREAMQAALARHHAILRTAIEANGGHVFNIVGDAFCAAFATAPAALAAAVAAQHALQSTFNNQESTILRIRVRMGLHTGGAESADGDYRSGPTLNRVARVMALAHGGQILVSQTTADLVRNDATGVTLRDMGLHRLKGLADPERIWQVVAPDLPSEFPPHAAAAAFPNNLPVQLTSFVGRDKEIAEVKRLLAGTRLLTLTGSGGTGKTRLSLAVAAELLDQYPDGVWFVELAPLSDPAFVPQTVAAALHLHEEPGRAILATLTDYLRDRRLLLILDNCEHLIAACAGLADALLHAAPHMQILASSREALGIAGEATYHVPSLPIPNPKDVPTAELVKYDSVRLFVERAAAAKSDFMLTEANVAAVAQICRRLDGIPLAIELAAARVKALPVGKIAERLDDRFRLLTGGSRTSLPRQQTLRSLIDWSYGLLTEPERNLLRRLSVFAGGWTLEAAEAVCADDVGAGLAPARAGQPPGGQPQGLPLQETDVLGLLTHLVDKSLVVSDEQAIEPRYRMLETIRQYGREKLLESGEGAALRSRHLDYFLKFAETVEPRLNGTDQARWFTTLETDHDNYRAAIEWALEDNEVVAGLRLAAALGFFWYTRSYYREGRERLAHILSQPEAAKRSSARSKALNAAAKLAWGQGDNAVAHKLAGEGLAIATEVGDQWNMAVALGHMGFAATARRSYTEAQSYLERAIALLREIGRLPDHPLLLVFLGSVSLAEGDYETALRRFEEARPLLIGRPGSGGSLMARMIGHIALHYGDTTKARSLYRESLALNQEIGDKAGVIRCIAALAGLIAVEGDLSHAARLLGALEALLEGTHEQLLWFEQDTFDQNIALVRAQLDSATFSTAWAEGRALTLEQAIALALKETDG